MIVSISAAEKYAVKYGWYAVGLHPWWIRTETVGSEFEVISKLAEEKNILAIGECGLDKVCDTAFALQQTWFEKQIQLANRLQKPLIIHCVKAFEETVELLHKNKVQVPVVFHGFNKSPELARRLLQQGYYISLGKFVMNERSAGLVQTLSVDRIFFETDESDIEIDQIYSAAAEIMKMDLSLLCEQIRKNATLVFGKGFTSYE